jgi:predicted Zn finger-like uncharacterized protein
MDVQCEACKTEYEFDDALVSERGTTVRCTSCGHRFKVHRRGGDTAGGDRWTVAAADGRELTFLTLRELQRAILAKQVTRGDILSRAGSPPRPLGAIAELEPFFEGRTSSRPPPGPTPDDPTAPQAGGLTFAKPSPALSGSDPPPSVSGAPDASRVPAMRNKMETLRPPGAVPPPSTPNGAAAHVPMPAQTQPYGVAPMAPDSEESVSTWRAFSTSATPPPPPAQPPSIPPPPVFPGALPPPTEPVRRPLASEEDLHDVRAAFPSSADEPYRPPRRRRVGGWIVAMALVLAVGVVAWAVAKQSLAARNTAATTVHLDPRAQRFLDDGEKALSEGDLDAAQGAFDRASVLAEGDARVLLDEARVADAKADLPWLRLRLLAPEASDEARATRAQLDERVQHALKTSDDALAAAPADPPAARAKLDALRLAGRGGEARGFVGKVIMQASQPETAYALAALDLAEPEPLWTTVLERLRTACTGDAGTARARAALVYALARSGDGAGARQELDRLDAMARPYPLLPELHAFVDRVAPRSGAAAPGHAAGSAAPSATAATTPAAPAAPAPPAAAPPATAAAPRSVASPAAASTQTSTTRSGRGGLQAAAQAMRRRDFDGARSIYESIVAANPSDSEAIAGLGDVARLQGDSAGAVAAYKRAIAINPSYLPALLALADIKWSSGDRAGAVKAYDDLIDRFPEGTYPAYVKQRAEGGATPAPAQAPASTAAPEREPPAPPKPPPATDQDGL